MKPRYATIANERTGGVVCGRGRIASTFCCRLAGLLGRRAFGPGDGLLIRPSSAVHTWGMAFPIDVVALDKLGCVLAMRPNLEPLRVAFFSLRSRDVLELPAGHIALAGIQLGDRLLIALQVDDISNPR